MVVLSSMMLHHLPIETRRAGVSEMRRVLTTGGRLLAIDFGRPSGAGKRGFLARIHGHGGVDTSALIALIALVTEAGFEVTASGWAGKWDLRTCWGPRHSVVSAEIGPFGLAVFAP